MTKKIFWLLAPLLAASVLAAAPGNANTRITVYNCTEYLMSFSFYNGHDSTEALSNKDLILSWGGDYGSGGCNTNRCRICVTPHKDCVQTGRSPIIEVWNCSYDKHKFRFYNGSDTVKWDPAMSLDIYPDSYLVAHYQANRCKVCQSDGNCITTGRNAVNFDLNKVWHEGAPNGRHC